MIFLEKKGRFGNFLFQYFVAKFIQELNGQKIIVFSKNENNYHFNSKKNIDKLVNNCHFVPKYSKILNIFKKFFFQINDLNFKNISKNNLIDKKNIYLSGFFQDIDFVVNNHSILPKILDKKKIIKKNNFKESDLTIHIRHLHHEIGTLDTNPFYQKQPNLDFYKKIIDKTKPKSIKVISSNEQNKTYLDLKSIYGDLIYFDGRDDISDFFNLISSNSIILSVSTYSLWASLLSEASEIYVPNIGILKNILKEKKISVLSKYKYLNE